MHDDGLPVVVIGAGPVGLAAAAHLRERGLRPLVLEAGDEAGRHVRQWGHVRLFSPWKLDLDAACLRLLRRAGWRSPEPEALPTGRELVESYLRPLASLPALARHIRYGVRVEAVSRRGLDKLRSEAREERPFLLRVRGATGVEEVEARAVVDASGTWAGANPLGSSGIPAPGEEAAADRVHSRIPDVLGRDRAAFAGRRVLVIGSGDSSLTIVSDLALLAADEPRTEILWGIRGDSAGRTFAGGGDDRLPARRLLGARARRLLEDGALTLRTGFRVARLETVDGGRLRVQAEDGRRESVDRIIAATGFRPDLAMLRELRLDLDGRLECPRALAARIDPEIHSCGTVQPHGAAELAHPEPGFYIVGMKSYGRAPTFLLLTGYEQVRSVAAAIAGDRTAAAEVELELPDAGGCGDATRAPGSPER